MGSEGHEGDIMASNEQIQIEINTNLEYFLRQLPSLLKTHRGQYALMRKGEVIGFHPSAEAAQTAGKAQFADGLFSIQKIVEAQVDLGFFSHAVHLG